MRRTVAQLTYAALVVGLLIVNVLLQRQNHELVSKIDNLEAGEGPLVGSRFDRMTGADLDDSLVTLDFAQEKSNSLFLVVSQSCEYCDKNWTFWLKLLRQRPDAHVVIADAAGDLSASYFRKVGADMPRQFIRLSPAARAQYGLRVTPTTVVLGERGRVLGVWLGVLSEKKVSEIERLLNVQGGDNQTKEKGS